MEAIKVNSLCKDYYQYKVLLKGKLLTKALVDVSFKVKKGDFCGLLGLNGAGKTTLMKILTTNLLMTSGEAYVNGYNVEKEQDKVKDNISWMFGLDYAGIGWSSVEKNLKLAASFLGVPTSRIDQRVEDVIKSFNLLDYQKLDVWRLSTGTIGRYSLAVAMLKEPEILFLDEPLLGLDVESKQNLVGFLKELNTQGVTIFYTSHQLPEIEKACKSVIIINKGKLSYKGDIEELKQKYKDLNTIEIRCKSDRINKILMKIKKSSDYIIDYDVVESIKNTHFLKIFTSMNAGSILVKLGALLQKNKVEIEQINAGILSLEDVFRKVVSYDKYHEQAEKIRHFHAANEQPSREHLALLSHKHPKVRAHAIMAFWNTEKEKTKKLLGEMLSAEKETKIHAIQAIGHLKSDLFLENLKQMLQDPNKDIRKHAAIAIAKIGDNKSVDIILSLLLSHNTVNDVLEHIKDMHPSVLMEIGKKIRKLGFYDRSYIRHHINKMANREDIANLLHLNYYSYRHWEMEKGHIKHMPVPQRKTKFI